MNAQLENYQLREATLGDIDALVPLINRAYRPIQGQEGWTYETLWVSGGRIQPQASNVLILAANWLYV